jgi:hypothetical protein
MKQLRKVVRCAINLATNPLLNMWPGSSANVALRLSCGPPSGGGSASRNPRICFRLVRPQRSRQDRRVVKYGGSTRPDYGWFLQSSVRTHASTLDKPKSEGECYDRPPLSTATFVFRPWKSLWHILWRVVYTQDITAILYKKLRIFEISNSQGSECEDGCLLRCWKV